MVTASVVAATRAAEVATLVAESGRPNGRAAVASVGADAVTTASCRRERSMTVLLAGASRASGPAAIGRRPSPDATSVNAGRLRSASMATRSPAARIRTVVATRY